MKSRNMRKKAGALAVILACSAMLGACGNPLEAVIAKPVFKVGSESCSKDDAKVIVTTIYNPAGNMKLPSTLNKIVEDIIENMNAIIEKRAGKYDYEVADVYQSSVISHLQKDGVHPDSQGQQIIADLVCKEYEK